MSFLVGEAMTGGYGSGADILHACTIAVDRGEIAVIVGPNGAGKSTAMKAVFGMLPLREGRVLLDGRDITGLTPQDFTTATSFFFLTYTLGNPVWGSVLDRVGLRIGHGIFLVQMCREVHYPVSAVRRSTPVPSA